MDKQYETLGTAKGDRASGERGGEPRHAELLESDYMIVLINMTDSVLTKHRVRVGQNAWTSWYVGAPIGRTCSSGDAQTCYEQKAWKQVTSIGCGGPAFDIEVRNDAGEGGTWTGLSASCSAAGGVLVLAP